MFCLSIIATCCDHHCLIHRRRTVSPLAPPCSLHCCPENLHAILALNSPTAQYPTHNLPQPSPSEPFPPIVAMDSKTPNVQHDRAAAIPASQPFRLLALPRDIRLEIYNLPPPSKLAITTFQSPIRRSVTQSRSSDSASLPFRFSLRAASSTKRRRFTSRSLMPFTTRLSAS
jgi:hypothetical protein